MERRKILRRHSINLASSLWLITKNRTKGKSIRAKKEEIKGILRKKKVIKIISQTIRTQILKNRGMIIGAITEVEEGESQEDVEITEEEENNTINIKSSMIKNIENFNYFNFDFI